VPENGRAEPLELLELLELELELGEAVVTPELLLMLVVSTTPDELPLALVPEEPLLLLAATVPDELLPVTLLPVELDEWEPDELAPVLEWLPEDPAAVVVDAVGDPVVPDAPELLLDPLPPLQPAAATIKAAAESMRTALTPRFMCISLRDVGLVGRQPLFIESQLLRAR
jgi:hypothetical protein